MDDLLKAGGLLGLGGGRLLLFFGPFTRTTSPPAAHPAVFAPDFFLANRTPWHIPARVEETSQVDFLSRLADRGALPPLPALAWQGPDRPASYTAAFAELEQEINLGRLRKAVPVAFSRASCPEIRETLLPRLIRNAVAAPTGLIPYGIWDEAGGMVGATPELLFDLDADGVVRTMALAATAPPGETARLMNTPKEQKEHCIVVEEVSSALALLGVVEREATEVLSLPHLAHLRTAIQLKADRPVTVSQLVGVLHPTPALGGSPRDKAVAWLRTHDRNVGRGRFGAPFGHASGHGPGCCVVAIRSVEWAGSRVRIGTGAGVVADSRFQDEWEELDCKRESVLRTLLA